MRLRKHSIQGSPPAETRRIISRLRGALIPTVMLAPLAFLLGCSGIVKGQNAQATSPQIYSISGMISPVAGGSGATLTLSGAATATTTADGAGNYAFAGLANGTYAVTPSRTGYTFSPNTQATTVSGTNVTGLNFTASPQVAHSVVLAWIASTTSTVTGYNVYRSLVSGTNYVQINSSIVLAPLVSYTDTTPSSGTTYYYVTTAVDANGSESAFSNEVSAVIP